MDDFISREAAIKAVCECSAHTCKMGECFNSCNEAKALSSIPAADVVEVVRCRDCVYWRGENDICKGICIDFSADGYCSEGKRKDGGQDE